MYIRIPFPERRASSFFVSSLRPKSGKTLLGKEDEEASKNLNVSLFWLQFTEGRLGPKGICRFNSEISVDAINPQETPGWARRTWNQRIWKYHLAFLRHPSPGKLLAGWKSQSLSLFSKYFLLALPYTCPSPTSGSFWVPHGSQLNQNRLFLAFLKGSFADVLLGDHIMVMASPPF